MDTVAQNPIRSPSPVMLVVEALSISSPAPPHLFKVLSPARPGSSSQSDVVALLLVALEPLQLHTHDSRPRSTRLSGAARQAFMMQPACSSSWFPECRAK